MQKELLSAYMDGEEVSAELTEQLCQDKDLQEYQAKKAQYDKDKAAYDQLVAIKAEEDAAKAKYEGELLVSQVMTNPELTSKMYIDIRKILFIILFCALN